LFPIKKRIPAKIELFFQTVEITRKSVQNYPVSWKNFSHILPQSGDRMFVFSPGNQKLPLNPDNPIPWGLWKND